MQLQVLSEAFISTEKADPNACLLPHLNLLETAVGGAAITEGTAAVPLKKKNLGHKKKFLIFNVLLLKQDSPFLKLNCLPKLLGHPMPLRRAWSRMEIRVDAVAELNSTPPRQLGTRKATESGHADQGGCCGRAKQHTAPPARDKESIRIWIC
jgi:hypothetical protein